MTVEHAPRDVDASELTYEEWFFLWAAFGQKPEAKLTDAAEWNRRSAGMTPQQKQMTVRLGLESLIARGVIVQDKNADGSLAFDQNSQPIFKGMGRIVSRIRETKSVIPNIKH